MAQDDSIKGILEDPTIQKLLDNAHFRYLSMGEVIPAETFSKSSSLLITKGKVRVLQTALNGYQSTLTVLTAPLMINVNNYNYVFLCSTPLEIVELPRVKIDDYPKLNLLEEYTSKLISLESSLPITSPSALPSLKPEETLSLNEAEEVDVDFSPQEQVSNILRFYNIDQAKVFTYYNVEDLEQKLKDINLKVESAYLQWKQILNHQYPFILVDDKNIIRWITGRKGNTLLEERGDTVERYIPDPENVNNKFKVLNIDPKQDKSSSEKGNIFSVGWYLKLYLNNMHITGQMIFSSILIQIFALGLPLFYLVIFDKVFRSMNLSALLVISIGLVIILVFDLVIKLLRSYVLSHFLEHTDKVTSEIYLKKFMNLPLSKINRGASKGYVEQFAELIKANHAIAQTYLVSSLDLVFSVILVAVLLLLNVKIALIALSPIIPIGLIIFFSNPKQRDRAQKYANEQRTNQIKLSEIVDNNETIKSINAERFFLTNTLEHIYKSFENNFGARFDKVNSSPSSVISFITMLGSFATLYFGAIEVIVNNMSFGIYITISMLSRTFLGSVQKMIVSLQQYQEVKTNLKDLKELFTLEDEKQAVSGNIYLKRIKGNISINDLYYKYDKGLPFVLENINLEINAGEKIILCGKSGSGKTTLLRLIHGLYIPTSGFICIDAYKTSDIDPNNMKSLIGYSVQKAGMFTGNIRSNLLLGNPKATTEEIINVTTITLLDQVLMKMPKGLDTPVYPRGSNLSGGQIAQVELARTLITNPDLLIIDETLNSVDFMQQETIFKRVLEKYKTSTCLIVTDYMPLHRLADRIIVLHEGKVVEQGRYEDLLDQGGYYYHLHPKELMLSREL